MKKNIFLWMNNIQKTLYFKIFLWEFVFLISLSPSFTNILGGSTHLAVYFLILSFVFLYLKRKQFTKIISKFLFFDYFIIIGLLCTHFLVYFFLNEIIGKPINLPVFPHLSFIQVDGMFLIEKPFEILWQQILIVWLFITLQKKNLP
jgi:hypothetical protein